MTSRAPSHVPQDPSEKKCQKKTSSTKARESQPEVEQEQEQTIANEQLQAFNFASIPQEFMQLTLYAHSFMCDGSTI